MGVVWQLYHTKWKFILRPFSSDIQKFAPTKISCYMVSDTMYDLILCKEFVSWSFNEHRIQWSELKKYLISTRSIRLNMVSKQIHVHKSMRGDLIALKKKTFFWQSQIPIGTYYSNSFCCIMMHKECDHQTHNDSACGGTVVCHVSKQVLWISLRLQSWL